MDKYIISENKITFINTHRNGGEHKNYKQKLFTYM